jgi:hypothetical protein
MSGLIEINVSRVHSCIHVDWQGKIYFCKCRICSLSLTFSVPIHFKCSSCFHCPLILMLQAFQCLRALARYYALKLCYGFVMYANTWIFTDKAYHICQNNCQSPPVFLVQFYVWYDDDYSFTTHLSSNRRLHLQ